MYCGVYNFPLVWMFRHVCFRGYGDLTKPSINGKLCLVFTSEVRSLRGDMEFRKARAKTLTSSHDRWSAFPPSNQAAPLPTDTILWMCFFEQNVACSCSLPTLGDVRVHARSWGLLLARGIEHSAMPMHSRARTECERTLTRRHDSGRRWMRKRRAKGK